MPFQLCFHSYSNGIYLVRKHLDAHTHLISSHLSPCYLQIQTSHVPSISFKRFCFSWSNSFGVHNLIAWAGSVSHSNNSKQMFPISIILLPFSRHPPCPHMLVCKRDNFLCMHKQHRESSSVGVWQYAEFYVSTVWNLLFHSLLWVIPRELHPDSHSVGKCGICQVPLDKLPVSTQGK